MNNHPRPIVVLQTTTDIFNHTTSIFSTRNNLLMFLLLSFIFFSLRIIIDLSTEALISYIDNQPSIKSFYSPIPHSPPKTTSLTTTLRLQNDFDRRFFSTSLPNRQSNDTPLILDTSNPQFDNGIRAAQIFRSSSNFTFVIIQNDSVSDEINVSAPTNDSTDVLFHFGVFSVSYVFLMGGFIIWIQSIIHGVVFVLVMSEFCGRNKSFAMVIKNGFRLDLRQLYDINLKRWMVRCFFTMRLCRWFFNGKDRYSGIKILARGILMPYSIFTPSVKGFEVELSQGFVLLWLMGDFFISFLLTLGPWILMGDPTRNDRQVVKEGWHFLWLKFLPGLILKGYEDLVCGPFGRWVLATTFGDLFAIVFQAFMEVYFLVAWLMYYLSVKSIDANARGQPFGQPQLEAMLVDGI